MEMDSAGKSFISLLGIMSRLRSPEGCPWDAQQTPESLKPYLLEEAYELLEAIDDGNSDAVREELGDLLLQIVFQARIYEERGEFDIRNVVEGIAEKLVRRHPHVFSDARCRTPEEVTVQWENIKAQEKSSASSAGKSVLGQVPQALPALMRASKLTARASRAGFDWPKVDGVFAKVHEEIAEFEAALQSGDQQSMENELGDMLFAIANLGRFLNIDPEGALRKTIDRFIFRFSHIEKTLGETGRHFQDTSLEEMSELWQSAKKLEDEKQTRD
ncbi:MAG: nucleoside triphosphate pyrophosphohydrolase [Syntrophotaleaceae bacterium]